MIRKLTTMRSTTNDEFLEAALWDQQESVLLAILNLGKNRRAAYWDRLIKYAPSIRPGPWTLEVQDRIIALCRSAISISATLRSLPTIRNLNEGIQRDDELVKPLNDAFADFSIRPYFHVDFVKGQSVLVKDDLVTGITNGIEGEAMLALRNMMKRGEIEHLRECGMCGAWFIADSRRRKEHKWCSVACRQKNKRSTPEFKEQRRKNYNTKKFLPASKRKKVKTNAKKRG